MLSYAKPLEEEPVVSLKTATVLLFFFFFLLPMYKTLKHKINVLKSSEFNFDLIVSSAQNGQAKCIYLND